MTSVALSHTIVNVTNKIIRTMKTITVQAIATEIINCLIDQKYKSFGDEINHRRIKELIQLDEEYLNKLLLIIRRGGLDTVMATSNLHTPYYAQMYFISKLSQLQFPDDCYVTFHPRSIQIIQKGSQGYSYCLSLNDLFLFDLYLTLHSTEQEGAVTYNARIDSIQNYLNAPG